MFHSLKLSQPKMSMQMRKSVKSGVTYAALLTLAVLKTQAQTTATWTGPASDGD